jgi:hypothetical protein
MQTMIRGFLAKRRVTRIRVTYPSVAFVTVVGVNGLVSGQNDPVAYISGVSLSLPITHPARINPFSTVTDELIKSSAKVNSHYKVDNLAAKTKALATSLTNLDYVAITLVDKTVKDDFLGQVSPSSLSLSRSTC